MSEPIARINPAGLVVVSGDVFGHLERLEGRIAEVKGETEAIRRQVEKLDRRHAGSERWLKMVERVLVAAIAAYLGARELGGSSVAKAAPAAEVAPTGR